MDPARAPITLEELIEEDADHRDAYYRLAQELFLLGRYAEAHRACERLIELATAPGHPLPPEELARYYDYLGRILEAAGDRRRGARRIAARSTTTRATRRRRCARAARGGGGDRGRPRPSSTRRSASPRRAGRELALPLQRGLARFFVASGDRAARDRGVPRRPGASSPTSHDDRVALAELCHCRSTTLNLRASELRRCSARPPPRARVSPARVGLPAHRRHRSRGARAHHAVAARLRRGDRSAADARANVKRGALVRRSAPHAPAPPPVLGACTEALAAVRESLDELLRRAEVHDAMPASAVPDPGFKVCVVDAQRLFGVDADVFVGDRCRAASSSSTRPSRRWSSSASFVERPDGERRFLLGRAFEAMRGGYALVTRLRAAQRAEVGHLLDQLIKPESEREPQVRSSCARCRARRPRRSSGCRAWRRATSIAAGSRRSGRRPIAPASWRATMSARRRACWRGSAARSWRCHLMARWRSGRSLGGAELVSFFLSDAYHELRSTLGDPAGRL